MAEPLFWDNRLIRQEVGSEVLEYIEASYNPFAPSLAWLNVRIVKARRESR